MERRTDMRTHEFENTKDAYDATQCDEEVKDGELILVESEKVVGVVWTWPFAVTEEKGELHGAPAGVERQADEINRYCIKTFGDKDRGEMWRNSVKEAVKLAESKGWKVAGR